MCAFFAYDPTKGAIKVMGDVTTSVDDKLGTPGTGEPAHAGGSTGLIGWARDILANGASILAKIAAAGTSAAPSADVVSVQYPNAYVSKATLGGLDQALTVDTLGAAQIAFHFPQATVSLVIIEGVNSNAATPFWTPMKFLRPSPVGAVTNMNYSASGQNFGAGDIILVSCAGFDQIRCRVSTHTSAFEVLASRIFSPGLNHVFAELSNQTTVPVSVSSMVTTGVYYTDTTTPLAGGATFTGSTRLVAEGNNYFNARANSDVSSAAANVVIEETPDVSVNWRVAASGSVWAGGNSLVLRITKTGDATYRIRYTNGGAAQAWLLITSSQTPN